MIALDAVLRSRPQRSNKCLDGRNCCTNMKGERGLYDTEHYLVQRSLYPV